LLGEHFFPSIHFDKFDVFQDFPDEGYSLVRYFDRLLSDFATQTRDNVLKTKTSFEKICFTIEYSCVQMMSRVVLKSFDFSLLEICVGDTIDKS